MPCRGSFVCCWERGNFALLVSGRGFLFAHDLQAYKQSVHVFCSLFLSNWKSIVFYCISLSFSVLHADVAHPPPFSLWMQPVITIFIQYFRYPLMMYCCSFFFSLRACGCVCVCVCGNICARTCRYVASQIHTWS